MGKGGGNVSLFDIPELRPLTPPEETTVAHCCKCKEDFLYGDTVYRDGKDLYCEECFKDFVCDFVDTSPQEIGERLGFDVMKHGKDLD